LIVDLHVHASRSSFCSDLSPEDMFEKAKKLGSGAIAVKEHSTCHGAHIAYEMGSAQGFPVFKGVEVATDCGDMLVKDRSEDHVMYHASRQG